MRATEFLTESRGVTARAPGETYVNTTDTTDILTIQNIDVIPDNATGYDSYEELEAALQNSIPDQSARINDNMPNKSMLAAIVATVTDADNKEQYWVRYIKEVPAMGVTGLWRTLRGYKYSVGAKTESLPVKPSDMVTDENYRSVSELAQIITSNIDSQMQGTGHDAFAAIMHSAVDQALTGKQLPIQEGMEYAPVLSKYAGEYLGPMALISAPSSVGGNTSAILQHFGLRDLKGAQVMFPQDTSMALIDSVIKTADNQEIRVSSKISKAGGAASSLSGVWAVLKDMPETIRQYPTGSRIIEQLATYSAVDGPMSIAMSFGVLDQRDYDALKSLDRSTQNIDDLGDTRIAQLTREQNVQTGTFDRPEYRVFYHALTAVTNTIMPIVNGNAEFKSAMLAALNNNQYVQIMTHAGKRGNDIVLSYSTKFPAVFNGHPQLVNKSYFATGQKGRIGFKLK